MMQIIAGWWHQHHHSPDASAICQDSNSSEKSDEKMTVTLTTGWRLQPRWQCVAIYEVSNDPSFLGGQTVISSEGWVQSCYFRRFGKSDICRNGSCHPSRVIDDADVDNHQSWSDETRRKKLLKRPNQSLSSGATELLLWRSKLILVFMILAVLWISWPCNARLWETIDQKRKKPYKIQVIQIAKIVFGDWSKLPGNHKPFPHLGRRRIQICKKNF